MPVHGTGIWNYTDPAVRGSIAEEGVLKKLLSVSGHIFKVLYYISINTMDEFFVKLPELMQHFQLLFFGEVIHDRQEEIPGPHFDIKQGFGHQGAVRSVWAG